MTGAALSVSPPRRRSLRERVLRGGAWLVTAEGATRVVALLKIAILARLLSPDDFGLMGTAMLVLQWVEYFSQTGFNAALVQKQGDIRPYLDTAWTVQVGRSMVLGLVVFFVGAPVGAAFFRNDGVAPLIRAIAVTTVIRGLGNPAAVYIRKELDFFREFLWRSGGAVAGLVIAVPIALVYRSVWALAFAVIGAQLVETVITYVVRPYRPHVALHWGRARELMRFGKWVFGLNVVAFFNQQMDSIVVGRVLGLGTLGFYQMARDVAAMPTSQIGLLISGVMFPAYAELRERAHLRRAFLRALALVSVLVIPVGCLLVVFAELLILLLLGARWISIVPTFRILVCPGVLAALSAVASPLDLALGRPDVPTKAALLRLATIALLILPLMTALGGQGVALAVALASVVGATYQFTTVARTISLKIGNLVGAVRAAGLASLPFLAAGVLVLETSSTAMLVVAAVGATGIYLGVLATTVRREFALSEGGRP